MFDCRLCLQQISSNIALPCDGLANEIRSILMEKKKTGRRALFLNVVFVFTRRKRVNVYETRNADGSNVFD